MEGLLLILALVAALLLWGAISPRSQWRTLAAWAYRDPKANEPSDAMFTLTRVSSVVVLVVLVWQCIALATAGDDTDARPAATSRPAAVSDEDRRTQLRSAFGVDEATVVTPPVVTTPPASVRPVKVLRNEKVDAARPPAYVAQALAGRTGTWLVLGVRADAPPTSVDVGPVLSAMVAVTVLADCASAPAESGATFYLVTVRLPEQLADRLVVDATGRPIP